jgi:hypothetical protein
MELDFIKAEITCGITIQKTQSGYKLSTGVILLPLEWDINGHYFGVIGLDGMYLRTGKRYRPVLDSCRHLYAFQEVE